MITEARRKVIEWLIYSYNSAKTNEEREIYLDLIIQANNP